MTKSKLSGIFAAVMLALYGVVFPVTAYAGEAVQVHLEAQQPVNLNAADASALQSIRGIGPALADRIIAYRQAHEGFKSTEELMEVRGIGKAKYMKIKNELSV